MQKARVANPGPAGLLVINPNRGKKMATKRRRRTTAKRRTTAARRTPNTTIVRRKRRTRRANPTTYASTRRQTTRRRSVSRRRNSSTSSLVSQAVGLAAGITLVGFAQGFVPPIGGVSPIAVAARQAGTGYLVGVAMEKFNVMKNYANEVKLAGIALGAGTLINAWVLPTVMGIFRPAPQPANGGGMADLVTLPAGNYDPYYGSTPKIGGAPVRVNKAAALRDLLAMPVMPGASQRFSR